MFIVTKAISVIHPTRAADDQKLGSKEYKSMKTCHLGRFWFQRITKSVKTWPFMCFGTPPAHRKHGRIGGVDFEDVKTRIKASVSGRSQGFDAAGAFLGERSGNSNDIQWHWDVLGGNIMEYIYT